LTGQGSPRQAELAERDMNSWLEVLERRDPLTYLHSRRVTAYAVALAEAAGLPGKEVEALQVAAMLHDLGKLEIPSWILHKKTSFTHVEWLIVRVHPWVSAAIAASCGTENPILEAILSHHERWCGAGYPRGLRGTDIPVMGRILAVADSFEAITADRTYRARRSAEEGLAELARGAGSLYDPHLVELFLNRARDLPHADG